MTYIADIKNIVSAANSTTSLLGSGATFTGAWEDVTNYNTVAVAVFANVATTGTLYIESSQDGGATVNSVPYIVTDTTFDIPKIWNVVETHIRIKYVNDAVAQTGVFQIQTKYSTNQELGVSVTMGDNIRPASTGQIVKAVSTGLDPNENFINIPADGYADNVSSQNLLGAGASFAPADCVYIDGFSQVSIEILSDQDGTFVATWYTDEACTDLIRTFTLPYTAANGYVWASSPTFGKYFKVLYTNGATPQTDFHLGLKLYTKPLSGFVLGLNDFVPINAVANISRSITMGTDPNGIFKNQPTAGIDDNNTTSALLGIGAVFTGDWSPVGAFGEIKVTTVSDQDAASCLLQLSHDGVTVHTSLSLPPQFIAGSGKYGFIHSLNPSIPYFRVVYTNGAVGQTEFNLTTLLLVNSGNGFISRATDTLNRYTDVKIVRSLNSPVLDINVGLVNYQTAGRKFGGNATVANTTFETVWEGAALAGPLVYIFPQAAETVRVKVGGDANDTLAGTGARTITVRGLDENWLEVDEDIDLAGASASAATTTTFLRVNKVFIKTVGVYGGSNTGDIAIENTSTNLVLAYVEAEAGVTYQTPYTVPAGKTMYLTNLKVSVSSGNSADVRMFHIDAADDITVPFTSVKHLEWEVRDFVGSEVTPFTTHLKFEEKNDIFFDAKRITGAGTAAVDVDYEFVLLDNI